MDVTHLYEPRVYILAAKSPLLLNSSRPTSSHPKMVTIFTHLEHHFTDKRTNFKYVINLNTNTRQQYSQKNDSINHITPTFQLPISPTHTSHTSPTSPPSSASLQNGSRIKSQAHQAFQVQAGPEEADRQGKA